MKKNITRFACALLALAVCLPLFACGGTATSADTQKAAAVTEQLSTTLDQVKNCEGEPFQLVMEAVEKANLQQYLDPIGMSVEDLCRAYLDGFDFSVDDVTVTGTTAQAKVTLTRRSIAAIIKDYLLSGHVNDGEAGKQALLSAISNTALETKEMRLGLSPDGDGWNVVDALTSALPHAVE